MNPTIIWILLGLVVWSICAIATIAFMHGATKLRKPEEDLYAPAEYNKENYTFTTVN